MPIYTVVQGDCLSSIALAHGFADWRTIYNHDNNAEFRRLRPNPNLIYPGDQVFIPETDTRNESVGVDNWHEFKIQGQKTYARVRLLDGDLAALQGKKYKLEVGSIVKEGTLGSNGLTEQEIPADAPAARLTLWMTDDTSRPGIIWDLRLGEMDPVEQPTGVQARLKNLGYDPGPIDGDIGDTTRAAIKAFQGKMGLTVNGQPDDATRAKLKEVHDGA